MTHTQTPDNLLVIDKEWVNAGLESVNIIVANYEHNKLLKDSEYYKYKGMQFAYKSALNNSYPLSPIVEDSLSNGANYMLQATYIGGMDNINYNSSTLLKCKQNYLLQPIKLEK